VVVSVLGTQRRRRQWWMWEGVGWCGAASTVTTSGVGTSAVAGISIGSMITRCVT